MAASGITIGESADAHGTGGYASTSEPGMPNMGNDIYDERLKRLPQAFQRMAQGQRPPREHQGHRFLWFQEHKDNKHWIGYENNANNNVVFSRRMREFLIRIRPLGQVPHRWRQCMTVPLDKRGSTKQGPRA